jgi:formylglycine-generating enzyme required for sulfatase activity
MDRRQFLMAAGLAAPVAAAARGLAARSQTDAFRGMHAGEERTIQGVRLRWCPPGRFVMGSPEGEAGHRPDEAQVNVSLTRGFWMATFETTQGEWARIVGSFPAQAPSEQFGIGDDVPMYWVSYIEADRFCAVLTDRAHAAGTLPRPWSFRLPTEAQWEYACRAGTTTASAFGEALTVADANLAMRPWNRQSGEPPAGRAVAVGRYRPNAWGLHDMHGNVWEWCLDWYHGELPGGTDPDLSHTGGEQNRDGTFSRVRRGGAWIEDALFCRSAQRLRFEPERRSDHIGFRVAAVDQ